MFLKKYQRKLNLKFTNLYVAKESFMIRKRHTKIVIFSQRFKKSVKKFPYHHSSSYFPISHAVFQRANNTQNLLINNEKS